ncbi:MAG: efflux RND transporter permease subunit, partial [Bdellovibrionales bacterium]|nr:efflux RND transporter permease subunit [Bdellovibrionales bacterium]
MIEIFVKRPATTVMFVLFFALLGIVSFFNLNVEQSPRIDFPLVNVTAVYPGASPLEVETQIIKKIEDAVVEISEIKKIESRSFESMGYVLIEFYLSADVNNKLIEVKDKVEAILSELPAGIDRPIVQKVDPFAKSVVSLALTSDKHSLTELYEYADNVLSNQFSKIAGVGQVEIFGGRKRQIRVELFPDLMKQKFISIDKVISQIRAKNITVPAGNIEQSTSSITVRYEGEFATVKELQDFQLTTSDGNRFPLKDIARVYDGQADMETGGRFNQKEVVSLSIKKISDGNEINVSKGIRKILTQIQPNLPEGMKLEIATDSSLTIQRETKSTYISIAIGILLTVLVLLFFTGNWRVTLVAALVIPISIVSSLFLMDISGFTINFITLLAVATSLGTLIANAIVIIESVLEHLQKGESSAKAAIEGTKDMIVPIMAAGGTNLVVFTPIAFMGGIIGQFMLQFGLTVVYATIFSLMASFSLTPMLCALLLKPAKEKSWIVRIADTLVQFLIREYKFYFDILMRYKITTSIVMVAMFIGAFSVAGYVGNEFIPVSDKDRIEVKLTLPLGSKVELSQEIAEKVEKLFLNKNGVDSVFTVLGENGEQNASVVVNLLPAANRSVSDLDIIKEVTPQLAQVSGAEIEVVRGDGGGGRNADISINVEGDDYENMVKASYVLMTKMKDSGYFRSLVSSYKDPKQELSFIPDNGKLEKYGVQSQSMASILRSSIYGDDSNIFRQKGEEYDIVVKLANEYVDSADVTKDLFAISNTGLVPVKELGSFEYKKSIPTIFR